MALIGSVTGSVEGNVVKNGAVIVSGSTSLSLASDSGEIDITTRQGNVDINATAGTVSIDGAGGINLGTAADVAFDIDTAALDIDSSGAVSITTTGGASDISLVTAHTAGVAFHIDANADAGSIVDIDAGVLDVDVTGNATIDAGGTFSVDAVGTSNLTTNGALTVSGSTGLNLASDSGEIDLTTRQGAVDINAATTVSIDGAGGINLGTTADVAFDIDTDTLDIDSSGAITIDSTSTFSVDAVGTSNVTTHGTLTVSGSDGLNLYADSGTIDIETRTGAVDIDAASTIAIDTTDTSNGVKIATATSGVPVLIGHTTSETTIQDNVTVKGNLGVNGIVTGSLGLSGSLTRLVDGRSYLAAGANVTITSASNGQVTIASSGGSTDPAGSNTQVQFNNGGSFGADSDFFFVAGTNTLNVPNLGASGIFPATGFNSVVLTSGSESISPGSDVTLFISGATNGSGKAVVGGDIVISGSILGGYDGEAQMTAVVVQAANVELTNENGFNNDLNDYGSDVFLFVSGAVQGMGVGGSPGVALFGGDVAVSGTLAALDQLEAAHITGSITKTMEGTSFIAAGANITVTSGTSGQIVIASSGGSTDPAGSNTQVQFNDGGSFGGDAQLTFNKATNNLAAQSITVSEYVTASLFYQYQGEPFNFSDGTLEWEAADTHFFVSGAATPAGGSTPSHPAYAVFNGDIVASGTIRGGYYAPAQINILNLKAGLTTIGAGTVPLSSANGGPGADVHMFISGSTDSGSNRSRVLFGGQVVTSGSIVPGVDNTIDLGASTNRWANIYTGDLHLKNDRGDWTMIEEETYLSLRNNKNGKLYRLLMEEVTE